jgi:hypothetical protein
VFNQALRLDSLTIVPGSVKLRSESSCELEYNSQNGLITIRADPSTDSILICYKVFPFDLYKEVKNRTTVAHDSLPLKQTSVSKKSDLADHREELFSTGKINKSGAISRGISFGNRQDIFVNSVLNLQMEGKLSDNLNIRASITDQNIPYQPEGNTKLVQDFDNVYFEIYNKDFSLTGGDIVLKSRKSDFLRFQRNVQGALINTSYKLIKGSESQTSLAYSISKGKFSTYQVKVLDGVMGPYKIYGPENETFIIIIANSERVYLDGRLLERGYNHDYIIDYNTGEITFTSRVLITRFSRVYVDFEYTNQSYSRSVMHLAHTQRIKDHEISIQYYQEKDNRNQPLRNNLNDDEKYLLKDIDPGITRQAILPGWDSVEYHDRGILYKKIDTLDVDGNPREIFMVSHHPDSARYEVVFSEAGWGKGEYIRKNHSVNGQIYEWVGLENGNFLPVRTVELPSMKRMITLRSNINIGKDAFLFNELAFSARNDNLFNKSLPDENGFALKTGAKMIDRPISFLPGYFFSGQVDAEYDNKNFNAIDRFRTVEYNRDWSYNEGADTLRSSDKIVTVSGSVKRDRKNHVDFNLIKRIRTGSVDGWQGTTSTGFDFNHFNISGELFLMTNKNDFQDSRWLRYHINSYIKTSYIYPGYKYSVDHNSIRPVDADSIISTAMNYEEHQIFIRNNDTLKTRFNVNYSIRKDRIPVYGEMQDYNLSKTTNIMFGTPRTKFGRFDLSVIYRQLNYLKDSVGLDENSLLGRFEWSLDIMKGHIKSELSYDIGNSRELRREYVYIQVPTGEGTHTWRDNNNDGIQDLSEFYPAINPDERNYIKLFTPTDDYVLAYDNNLNFRFNAEMPRSWKNSRGLKKILGKFSNSLIIQLRQKINQDDFWDNLLFSGNQINNEHLLSYRENIRNNLFFNRSDPTFGINFIFHQLNSRQLISNGFEARRQRRYRLESRINIRGDVNLLFTLIQSELSSGSDFLEGRNYRINGNEAKTTIEWQPSNHWRFSTDYSFQINGERGSNEAGNGMSKINESAVKIKYSKASNKNIDFMLRYTHIDFRGAENTALGYELLKGLKPGNNLTWSLIWQQKLFDGLQMGLNYEGRKSGGMDTIHIGRMQVMALF